MSALSLEEMAAYFEAEFPQAPVHIEAIAKNYALLRHKVTHASLRPGGTVSGPAMMATADAAMYAAILATVGVEKLAVTTNLNINFLHRPKPQADILAECRLLKVGKIQVMGEVGIRSEGDEQLVAHATLTYARPPQSLKA